MASGLLALLDDVAAIAKVAAASVDDVGALAIKAGAKSAGVVIDDAAVTPRYLVGFAAKREIPIVWAIAKGSLRNKLVFLLPGALILSFLAPWAMTPLLMFGGLFLCFEGAEKVSEALFHRADHSGGHGGSDVAEPPGTPAQMERQRVASAIKTDFILSAEIMALTLSTVATAPLLQKAVVLGVVGVGITAVVYGAVALIVKADDVGVVMAARPGEVLPTIGRAVVKAMPGVLAGLTVIGMVAMLMVGGGILLHGLEELGWAGPAHVVESIAHVFGAIPALGGVFEWLVAAGLNMIVGFAVGMTLIPVVIHAIMPLVGWIERRRATFKRT